MPFPRLLSGLPVYAWDEDAQSFDPEYTFRTFHNHGEDLLRLPCTLHPTYGWLIMLCKAVSIPSAWQQLPPDVEVQPNGVTRGGTTTGYTMVRPPDPQYRVHTETMN